MKSYPMFKLVFLFLIFIIVNTYPTFAQNQSVGIHTQLAFNSKHFLGLQNDLRSSDKGKAELNINYHIDNISSKLAFNYDGYNDYTLDRSYLEYTSKIANFGLGAIDRHWSFSDRTSLILSHNARPIKSIYLELKNTFSHNWLPKKANWSFEIFNGFIGNSHINSKSMLLGARATLSPIEGLDFEIIQTSQWGGEGYENGINALGAALFLDTNDKSNANINKMAGFGVSYLTRNNLIPIRIYGQAVGEDEAGNLPSCYAYLAGIEYSNKKIKYPTTLGVEVVDTRIDTTSHGNCGPNTFYNNSVYDYSNHGVTLGSAIDTEGISIEFFGQSQISQKFNIQYSTKAVIINDKNWSNHRLSSNRESGLINSLGIFSTKNNLTLNGNVYYQNFILNKTNIKDGYGIMLSSSIRF